MDINKYLFLIKDTLIEIKIFFWEIIKLPVKLLHLLPDWIKFLMFTICLIISILILYYIWITKDELNQAQV